MAEFSFHSLLYLRTLLNQLQHFLSCVRPHWLTINGVTFLLEDTSSSIVFICNLPSSPSLYRRLRDVFLLPEHHNLPLLKHILKRVNLLRLIEPQMTNWTWLRSCVSLPIVYEKCFERILWAHFVFHHWSFWRIFLQWNTSPVSLDWLLPLFFVVCYNLDKVCFPIVCLCLG